jgi:hypothetical protein
MGQMMVEGLAGFSPQSIVDGCRICAHINYFGNYHIKVYIEGMGGGLLC